MPVFLCRWQNGDVTFAAAADKAQAIGLLDLELDYAEDWQLTKINEFLLGLALTDEGEFEIDFIGEALSEQLNKTYPILAEARIQIAESGDRISSDQAKRILAEAVAKERARLEKATSPNADRTASTY